MAKARTDRIREIGRGETISFDGVEVTGVEAVHNGLRDRWGTEVEALGYRISGGGKQRLLRGRHRPLRGHVRPRPARPRAAPRLGLGTRASPPGIWTRSGPRWRFERLRPRLAVPIHWGTFFPVGLRRLRPNLLTDPPHEFARLARELAPEVEVRVLEPGSEMTLESR